MNMKKAIALFLLSIMCCRGFSAYGEEAPTILISKDDIYLLIDINGDVLIPPGMYGYMGEIEGSDALFFVEDPDPTHGYLPAETDGWDDKPSMRPIAIMNAVGELVTDFVFDRPEYLKVFPSGDIQFRKGGKYGIMDDNFREILAPQYDLILDNGQGGYFVIQGAETLRFVEGEGIQSIEIEDELNIDRHTRFSEGLCDVSIQYRIFTLFGYMNPDGKWAIEPAYKKTGSFCNGYAVASPDGLNYGLIDRDGNWVLDPINEKITPLDGELFLVGGGGAQKLLRGGTFEKVPGIHLGPHANVDVSEGMIIVNTVQGVHLYDMAGNLLNIYEEDVITLYSAGEGKEARCFAYSVEPDGWEGVEQSGTLSDISGNIYAQDIRIHAPWNDVIDEERNCAIYVFESEDTVYFGLVDDEGVVRAPAIYDRMDSTKHNCFSVQKDDEWGVINVDGDWILRLIGDKVQ